MEDVTISADTFIERLKDQRNSALDSAAQAWSAVDTIRAESEQRLNLKDEEISRLRRLLDSQPVKGEEGE